VLPVPDFFVFKPPGIATGMWSAIIGISVVITKTPTIVTRVHHRSVWIHDASISVNNTAIGCPADDCVMSNRFMVVIVVKDYPKSYCRRG